MAQVYSTPGVYVQEKSAFSRSAVPVATAIPAFIGYTEKALRGSKSLKNVPTRISSLGDFHTLFGGAPQVKFNISASDEGLYNLEVDAASAYKLYHSLKLYFANGGGDCYIVSVGSYKEEVKSGDILGEETGGGLKALLKQNEPTMVLAPDAVVLAKEDFYTVQQAILNHCGNEMKNRVAILDVYEGFKERTLDEEDVVNQFREAVGDNFLSYGTAYYPWLNTTVVSSDEIDFKNIANVDGLVDILTKEVNASQEAGRLDEGRANAILAQVQQLTDENANAKNLHNTLKAVSPMYKQVLADVKRKINLLPPSGAMAGVYALTDSSIGVHKAPANVSVSSVVSPAVNINSKDQEDLNLPLNGKAVNAIRTFAGKGVLVWGARTLDGNSQDWRYINVRRALIFLEQTVKNAAESYVFEPNTPNTWVNIKSMISNSMTGFWRSGILVGASESDAYNIEVGLGTTMTANDVLDGIMRIEVRVALSRPAEFIVITFQQQMAGAGGGDEGGEGGEE
ncbi:phage tail sheath family protein [Aureibacter tunicatorum]|uniref:Tail sheath protein C-terminal domain-containing protein n=1 Tax=Aureibacter tunicatorum TaxID=866807 RepID=A0AAE3XSD4_9BACT|nr:phage tail sheath subtilisin-like domain-containing protein [Aureibacter tunicatorum]MDR6241655.1 hypothetical protein [Aureibacter tunicatorum]BDD07359.1 hypothetical protein AUTU_48420 [Aureibacter tunicatorum]